jgi:hypothetical protein
MKGKNNMKKVSLIICVFLLAGLNSLEAKEAMTSKTHRLGMRAGVYSPRLHSNAVGADLELQFHAKIHENVDSGPSFGLFYRSLKNGDEVSNYFIVPLTFHFRVYPFSRGEGSGHHGWFSPYALVTAGYYFSMLANSNKINDTGIVIPEGLGGFGILAGAGIELGTLGLVTIPDFVWFIEATYRKCSMKSRRDYGLNLDGITLSMGARM